MKPSYNDSMEKARIAVSTGASPRRWICEVHRELYDLLDEQLQGDERTHALNLVTEAFYYGKKMSDRLKQLKDPEGSGDAPDNPNFYKDIEKRAERQNLLKRIKSVNIETIDWCNRKCEWCPNKDREQSPESLMHTDTIIRICRQLLDYHYTGAIHPFLNGEPTMDKRLPEIIQLIRATLKDNYIRVVTNGDGLRSAYKLDLLFSVGVDSVHMNHYDGPFANIRKAGDSQYPGLTHFGLKELMQSFYNRAGKVDYTPAEKVKRCEFFLNKLTFNWKGDLILCCSDFNSEVVFGNIMDEPLGMILNSEKYQAYYRAHKNGDLKGFALCEDCNRI